MPNPTTAAPTTQELDSGHEWYATVQAVVGFREGTGAPFCVQTGNIEVPPLPYDGYGELLTGDVPTWIANGNPLGTGPSMRFAHGDQALRYRGTGFGASPPATRTFPFVFRPRFAPTYGTAKVSLIGGNGAGSQTHGPGINVTAAGVITLGLIRSGGFSGANTPLVLTNGHDYAGAVEVSSTGRNYYLYDYTTQALVSGAGGNAGTDATALQNSANDADLVISGAGVNTSGYEGALGDFSFFGLDGRAWDSTIFAAFYADPWGIIRGTYAPGAGTLVTGFAATWRNTTTDINASCSRATSGASSGAYTRQWQLAFEPDFSDAANVAGATGKNVAIPRSSVGDRIPYLRCITSDGAASVTSTGPKIVGVASVNPTGRIARGIDKLLWVADSIGTGPIYAGFARAMVGRGRRVNIAQRALTGTSIYSATAAQSWQPTTIQASTTLLTDALTTASQDGITKMIIHLGHNDAAIVGNTAAEFKTRYQNILTYALANGITWIGMVFPNMRTSSESANALQVSYRAKMRELQNGTSVFLLDAGNYEYGAQNPGYSADGTHPQASGPGYTTLGILIADAYCRQVDPGALGMPGGTRLSMGL